MPLQNFFNFLYKCLTLNSIKESDNICLKHKLVSMP